MATLLGSSLEGYRRLLGLAIYRPDGHLIASGKGVIDLADDLRQIVLEALTGSRNISTLRQTAGTHMHILASLIRAPGEGAVEGVLVVVHDLAQLDERANNRLIHFGLWIGLIVLLLLILVVVGAWLFYDRSLHKLAEWMRQVRMGETVETPPLRLPIARFAIESSRLAASFQAARSAQRAQARAVVRADKVYGPPRPAAYSCGRLSAWRSVTGGQQPRAVPARVTRWSTTVDRPRRRPGHRFGSGAASGWWSLGGARFRPGGSSNG